MIELVRDLNRRVDARSLSTADARRGADALRDLDQVLGLCSRPEALPDGAATLLEERAAARAARDWAKSDRLRDELAADGREVEDTRDGQRWRLTGRRVEMADRPRNPRPGGARRRRRLQDHGATAIGRSAIRRRPSASADRPEAATSLTGRRAITDRRARSSATAAAKL